MGDGASGNGAAIGARLQLGGVIRQHASFVQGDDAVMVRRCWREPGEDLSDERFLVLAQERRPLLDYSERRADGLAVKGHGLARMSRQDDGVWRQCDQALEGRV